VGLVAANLGQPIVRGQRQRFNFIPGLTWHPGPIPAIAFSTSAHIATDSVLSYAFGLSWRTTSTSSRWPIEILARMDTDKGFRRGAFALGVSIGGENRFGAVITSPGDVSHIDGASVYGGRDAAAHRAPLGGPSGSRAHARTTFCRRISPLALVELSAQQDQVPERQTVKHRVGEGSGGRSPNHQAKYESAAQVEAHVRADAVARVGTHAVRCEDDGAAAREQQQRGVFLAGGLIRVERDVARSERAARAHGTREAVGYGRPDRDLGCLAEHRISDDRGTGDERDRQQAAPPRPGRGATCRTSP